ncbi:MAG: hypothetical protein IKV94_04990 [Clostridia bacterium]|nr:hypothetical protein [Clostridia bacterium]
MEDSSIRAITIGVGLFVILLTISAIVGYVTVARGMATVVDQGLRLDEVSYENILDYKEDVTIAAKGIEVKNFIRKYVGDENIKKISIIENGVESVVDKNLVFDTETNIVNPPYLFKINSNADVKMTKKTESDGKISITIEGTKIFIATE